MSPGVDPALARFAPVLGAVIGVAGVGLAVAIPAVRRNDPALARELWLRWLSWLALAAVVIGTLALGPTAWVALMCVISAVAFGEYARVTGLAGDRSWTLGGYLLIAATHAAVWSALAGGSESAFLSMPVWIVSALLLVPLASGRVEATIARTGTTLAGVLGVGWLLGHLAYLVTLPGGVGLVLLVTFLGALNDVAAFCVGKLGGRHPLRRALSPRKTWEGAVGALAVVLAAAWLLRWLAPACAVRDVLALGVLVSLGGTAGDLALAAMKRDAGVKDWGTSIPGHGGVLDRLNSLVLAAPLAVHYLCWVAS
jgi:phosphatidate cytidylyltransferase